jgi:peptidoglycan/LPS O-acetylase OafA/YrhL
MQAETARRNDVDGLRAVAVLAVIVYHAFPKALPGGFLGVDVFFVISGFVITSVIRSEMDAGRFSLWGFYARRIRRIYPALLVVIAATLLAGSWLMLPDSFAKLGESAGWAAIGFANLYFLSQVDYFAPGADTLPLLHTWSLGVEEQFYLVWPVLMLVLLPIALRFTKARWVVPMFFVIVGIAVATALIVREPELAFFSPFARAWELALGALAALSPRIGGKLVATASTAIGLVLVAVALVVGQEGTNALPGLVLGCAGAALVVWPKAEADIVARILGSSLPLAIGLMSYSLYLWHWPLLVLLINYYYFGMPVPAAAMVGYFAVLTLLSIATWLLIETPFRKLRSGDIPTVGAGVALAAAVVVGAWTVPGNAGFPARFPDSINELSGLRVLGLPTPENGKRPLCWITSAVAGGASAYQADKCISIDPSRPNVLLIGDSHAHHFSGAILDVFPEINFSFAMASGCKPVLGGPGQDRCTRLMDRVYAEFVVENRFDAIILSGQWTKDDTPAAIKSANLLRSYTDHIVILGPNGEYSEPLPALIAYSELRGHDLTKPNQRLVRPVDAERAFEAVLYGDGVEYYSLLTLMCPDRNCRVWTPGLRVPTLADENHFTGPAAVEILRVLRRQGLLAGLFD